MAGLLGGRYHGATVVWGVAVQRSFGPCAPFSGGGALRASAAFSTSPGSSGGGHAGAGEAGSGSVLGPGGSSAVWISVACGSSLEAASAVGSARGQALVDLDDPNLINVVVRAAMA